MKKILLGIALYLGLAANAFAQDNANVIKLDQTDGKFVVESMTVEAGKFVFEVTNKGVDREVGFVLVPVNKGKGGEHIKSAYLGKTIADGETSRSQVVDLKPGTYSYFCPLNPTPHYTIVVK